MSAFISAAHTGSMGPFLFPAENHADTIRRHLTPGEIRMAHTVFGPAIRYADVRVVDYKYFRFMRSPHVPDGNIYYAHDDYRSDFSDPNANSIETRVTFVHEMTHVWQEQFGFPVAVWGVYLDVFCAAGHLDMDWAYHADPIRPGSSLLEYNIEQQGYIAQTYFQGLVDPGYLTAAQLQQYSLMRPVGWR